MKIYIATREGLAEAIIVVRGPGASLLGETAGAGPG